jgi:hypothetical protein
VLWRAGARPALARLNRFEETIQVYCLRKDLLELTGKTKSGSGKGVDAEQAPFCKRGDDGSGEYG